MERYQYKFSVTCPGLWPVEVTARDKAEAILLAATLWGEDWQQIAWEAGVKKLGRATRPVCRKCGKVFGEPGQEGSLCADCRRTAERISREMREVRKPDRRAGQR